LRAGPLSDKTVIRQLNDNFINTWVLKPTLPALRDKAAGADTRRLAKAVLGAKQKGSPVDCVVLTPELALVAVQPVHDLLSGPRRADDVTRYGAFLTGALGKAKK
jgi:anthranilate phosphoribosyltransferase